MFRQAPAHACRLTQTGFPFAGVTPCREAYTIRLSWFRVLGFSSGGVGVAAEGGTQPPPPQPDFTIGLSTSTVNIAQGSSSAPVSVIVNGLNGFSGSVQVTLSGVPAGVTSNPASPFSVSSGQAGCLINGAPPPPAPGPSSPPAQPSPSTLTPPTPFSFPRPSTLSL